MPNAARSKATKLTKKKQRFADKVLQGQSQAQAAKEVFDTKYPAQMGWNMMQRDDVRNYMLQKFEEVGITSDEVALRMKEGFDAMTPPKKEGGTRYEDFFTRRLYLDMYFRLRGLYAPEKTEHVEKRIVLNITPELVKGLKDAGAIDQKEIDYIEGEVIEQATANQG
jgi:hypothetical protein